MKQALQDLFWRLQKKLKQLIKMLNYFDKRKFPSQAKQVKNYFKNYKRTEKNFCIFSKSIFLSLVDLKLNKF